MGRALIKVREHRLWFSDQPTDLELAQAHCWPCPLRGLCLAGAIERREQYGAWGGEIFAQGTIVARKRPRGRPAVRYFSRAPRPPANRWPGL